MPDHILRDQELVVDLAVVHLKLEPDEVRQDRRVARLCTDGHYSLAGFRSDDGEGHDVWTCEWKRQFEIEIGVGRVDRDGGWVGAMRLRRERRRLWCGEVGGVSRSTFPD
jgi:hypothetical protein